MIHVCVLFSLDKILPKQCKTSKQSKHCHALTHIVEPRPVSEGNPHCCLRLIVWAMEVHHNHKVR